MLKICSLRYALLWALLFSMGLLLSGCGSSKPVGYDDGRGYAAVKTAKSMVGKPYKWGGCSPYDGFDCSGYVWWVYRQHGLNLPRTASEQARYGQAVSYDDLRAGDIVVFDPPENKGRHTGIYTGNTSFLHSPKAGARVREESMRSPYWNRYFIEGRRVLR